MNESILVTGGTGVLGSQVVRRLVDDGRRVRVMSRRPQPPGQPAPDCGWAVADLRSGCGVAPAAAGVDTIVHCATVMRRRAEAEAVRTLIAAARAVGSPHLVYVSIVGVDRVPLGYYRGKLSAERLIERSGLPYTILRATQFHDLIRVALAGAARSPAMPVPAASCQPVDVRDVAVRLAESAVGGPAGRAADVGGPRVLGPRELARTYLSAVRRRRAVVPVRLPGKVFAGYRRGGHLAPEGAVDGITFEQYLAEHPQPWSASYRIGG